MALVVEDGTGKADAESFASVANFDDYCTKRGLSTSAFATEAAKEQALRKATDFMEASYRLSWKGTRVTTTQAISWPRYDVVVNDAPGGYGEYPHVISQSVVPAQVIQACVMLALKTPDGELAPDLDQKVVREKVDVIEVEYDRNAPAYKVYRAVDTLLAPFMGNANGSMLNLVRC